MFKFKSHPHRRLWRLAFVLSTQHGCGSGTVFGFIVYLRKIASGYLLFCGRTRRITQCLTPTARGVSVFFKGLDLQSAIFGEYGLIRPRARAHQLLDFFASTVIMNYGNEKSI